ncbi:MAG: hypothetical protein ABI367_13035 [Mucilaginibacter sp.]
MAGYYDNGVHIENLCAVNPKDILIAYGPTKLLVDKYHWHSPKVGVVASYTPKAHDVEDHFGVFRGVDQIEAFVQATAGSLATFLECEKNGWAPTDMKDKLVPSFIGIGTVNFVSYLEEGDTFVMLGKTTYYKFKQMVCEGRIFKAPKGLDLDDYFKNFAEERLFKYDLGPEFTLVSALFDITGRAIDRSYFNR